MGCCVSSDKSFASPHKIGHHSATAGKTSRGVADNGSRDPPSSMEEETVKEVLSETPFPKLPPPSNRLPEVDEAQKPVGNKIEEEDEMKKNVRFVPTIVNGDRTASEVSDLSSLSESLSTTAYTERLDDGEEVLQRISRSSPVKAPKNRAFPGDLGPKREMLPNRTSNRRSDQSPGRRNGAVGSVKLVQNRDIGQGMVWRGVRAEPHRRDPGEKSGRRSSSPAISRSDGGASRSGLGRTPSARKFGKSPDRAPATLIDRHPNLEEPNVIEGKSTVTTHSESLENPLVSLECFIFL